MSRRVDCGCKVEQVPARVTGGRLDGDHVEIRGEIRNAELASSPRSCPGSRVWSGGAIPSRSTASGSPSGSRSATCAATRPVIRRCGSANPPTAGRSSWRPASKRAGIIPCGIADDFTWTPLDLGSRAVHLHADPGRACRARRPAHRPGADRGGHRRAPFPLHRHDRRQPGATRPGAPPGQRPRDQDLSGTGGRRHLARGRRPDRDTELRQHRTPAYRHLECPLAGGERPGPALAGRWPAPWPACRCRWPADAPRVSLEWLADERMVLRVRSALPDDERGRGHQARLRERHYPAMRQKPLRDAVLYNSFTGRQYSDSPRAVHEELRRPGPAAGAPVGRRWTGRRRCRTRADAVPLWSSEWYEALATCPLHRHQPAPAGLVRAPRRARSSCRPGTAPRSSGSASTSRTCSSPTAVPGEAGAWRRPTGASWSRRTRSARRSCAAPSATTGELLEIGYPRNDVLFRATGREVAAPGPRGGRRARRASKVVLYAPTWRDDEYTRRPATRSPCSSTWTRRGGEARRRPRRCWSAATPTSSTRSRATATASSTTCPRTRTWPTCWPITDVLITDYSSVMFDFAHTGRPMLFFTYDLEHYRDKLRGFYFDFEARGAGPAAGHLGRGDRRDP